MYNWKVLIDTCECVANFCDPQAHPPFSLKKNNNNNNALTKSKYIFTMYYLPMTKKTCFFSKAANYKALHLTNTVLFYFSIVENKLCQCIICAI